MLDDKELQRMRGYCEKATPGPWTSDYDDHGMGMVTQIVGGDQGIIGPRVQVWHDGTITLFLGDDNQDVPDELEFILFARTDLPLCLDEIERLRRENAELHAALKDICGDEAPF